MHKFYSLVVSRRGRLVKALDKKYIGIYPHRFESCQRLQIVFGYQWFIFDTVFTLDAVSATVCVIVKKRCTCRML